MVHHAFYLLSCLKLRSVYYLWIDSLLTFQDNMGAFLQVCDAAGILEPLRVILLRHITAYRLCKLLQLVQSQIIAATVRTFFAPRSTLPVPLRVRVQSLRHSLATAQPLTADRGVGSWHHLFQARVRVRSRLKRGLLLLTVLVLGNWRGPARHGSSATCVHRSLLARLELNDLASAVEVRVDGDLLLAVRLVLLVVNAARFDRTVGVIVAWAVLHEGLPELVERVRVADACVGVRALLCLLFLDRARGRLQELAGVGQLSCRVFALAVKSSGVAQFMCRHVSWGDDLTPWWCILDWGLDRNFARSDEDLGFNDCIGIVVRSLLTLFWVGFILLRGWITFDVES